LNEEVRHAAHSYADLGWRVIPTDGTTKHPPYASWQSLATKDHEEINRLFDSCPIANPGVAIATGVESGIFVLDIDPGSGGDESLADMERTFESLPETPLSLTGSGGQHYIFKNPEGAVITNAAGTNLKKHGFPGIDVRGEGGQISAPPTIHRSGVAYEWEILGDPLDVKVAEAPSWLVDLLVTDPTPPSPRRENRVARPDDLPGDRWMAETEWTDLLEDVGATLVHRSREGEEFWSRPAKEGEDHFDPHTSATLYYKGSDVLKVFTPNWEPLEQDETYDKARFYVTYRADEFVGDTIDEKVQSFFAALGQEQLNDQYEDWFAQQAASIEAAAQREEKKAQEEDSWTPRSLLEAKHAGPPPPPDVFQREDGPMMLYTGKLNYMYGPPESGKSWGAQLATTQEASRGHKVLYLDFENDVRSFVERIVSLDLDERHYSNIVYVAPDRPINLVDMNVDVGMKSRRERFVSLLKHGYSLVVVDGVSNAMNLLGKDPLGHNDTVQFEVEFLRVLIQMTGAALVCIDHAPKNTEKPSPFGAQHKLAQVTGATYHFKIVKPFGRGMEGRAKITVQKDKPGYLRQNGLTDGYFGDLVLASKGGKLEASVQEPTLEENDDSGWVPETIMENLSALIVSRPGLHDAEALDLCPGEKMSWKKAALRKLKSENYVRNGVGDGRLFSVRPYGFVGVPLPSVEALAPRKPLNPFTPGTPSHERATELLGDPNFVTALDRLETVGHVAGCRCPKCVSPEGEILVVHARSVDNVDKSVDDEVDPSPPAAEARRAEAAPSGGGLFLEKVNSEQEPDEDIEWAWDDEVDIWEP
jgi:hypothetical protein